MCRRASELASSYMDRVPSPSRFFWQRLYPAYRSWVAALSAAHPVVGVPSDLWVLDDLAAVLYLYLRVHGVEGVRRYRHIFVDEAQSLSPLWLVVLKSLLLPGGPITLAGDVYQLSVSVFGAVFGGGSWRWARAVLGRDCGLGHLSVSYRSPAEIVELGCRVLRRSGITVDVRAVREEEGCVRVVSHLADFADFLARHPEVRSAAVICLFPEAAERAEQVLRELSAEARLNGRLEVLTVDGVGGAEFDAVLVPAVSDLWKPEVARAMYTAVSRAGHYLFVYKPQG
ncbi:MAG: hypothetical protein ACPLRW_08880 [Moorellales bacterium]